MSPAQDLLDREEMPDELVTLISVTHEVPEEWLRRVRNEFLSEEDLLELR